MLPLLLLLLLSQVELQGSSRVSGALAPLSLGQHLQEGASGCE
jgi:hypothetical protein